MKMDYMWLIISLVSLVSGCFITAFAWTVIFGCAFTTSLAISAVMYLVVTIYTAYRVISDIIKYYFG
jgi:hypothetical protein